MKEIICFIDGATEPTNPGGAMGVGVIVRVGGEVKLSHSQFYAATPANTNNIAEYLALEVAIDYLLQEKLDNENCSISADSQLVIRQMIGEYGMNSGAYIPYAQRCLTKLASFRKPPKFLWIPREQNTEADELSKNSLIENNIPIAKRGAESDVLFFGKYKGMPISAITDMDYLKWLLREGKIKASLKTAIQERISQYEFLAK